MVFCFVSLNLFCFVSILLIRLREVRAVVVLRTVKCTFSYLNSVNRIMDKGVCDIRVRPCMRTIVFGEFFLDSENLTCHINEFSVSSFIVLLLFFFLGGGGA